MSVTFNDFERLSLKIGRITSAERIPEMSKIIMVNVDIGDRITQAIVGGVQYYDPRISWENVSLS